MVYSIFRNSSFIVEVKPLDSSVLTQKKQTEDTIRLNFVLDTLVPLYEGDYIFFDKTQTFYYMNKTPRIVESPANYQYECIFEGLLHELRKTKIFLTTPKEEGFYFDYRFSLSGNAETFLDLIVENLNRTGVGYTKGIFKAGTPTVSIDFNNWNAFDAITEICKVLNISWYFDRKILNFDEKIVAYPPIFRVGRLAGLLELTRMRVESENTETVVYGYGSKDNLPPRVSDGITFDSNLLSENRLSFVGVDGLSKLENNVALYGRIESIQEFDDIKPERTGTVSSISEADVRIFYDTEIDFDIEQQKIGGLKPRINFLTGLLMGLSFDVSFDYTTKRITMDYYTDSSGQYPNSLIKVKAGDTYKLFNIIMPESYIEDAKVRLRNKTQEYINGSSNRLQLYEGKPDPAYIEDNEIVLNIGDYIRIVSSTFAIDNLYEIKELSQNITDPTQYTFKFGDVLPKGLLALLKEQSFKTGQQIYNVQKTTITINEANNVVNNVTNVIGEEAEWQAL